METLLKLRPHDRIQEYTRQIQEKNDMAYLHAALIDNPGIIFIATNYTNEIMDKFLEEVDVSNSGYIFFQTELDIDPVNNYLVPPHRYATQDELDELEEKHIPLSKLPVLRMKDPIRRWHNFSVNSVIVIERNNGLYYRRCV